MSDASPIRFPKSSVSFLIRETKSIDESVYSAEAIEYEGKTLKDQCNWSPKTSSFGASLSKNMRVLTAKIIVR